MEEEEEDKMGTCETNFEFCLCGAERQKSCARKQVFDCLVLVEMIKDFAGILSEYPMYFITKFAPRRWWFIWSWKNDSFGFGWKSLHQKNVEPQKSKFSVSLFELFLLHPPKIKTVIDYEMLIQQCSDVNLELIFWYAHTLPNLQYRSDYLRNLFLNFPRPHHKNLQFLTKEHMLWLGNGIYETIPWLQYHFYDLQWPHGKNSLELFKPFLSYKLTATARRFLQDYAAHFDYSRDTLVWPWNQSLFHAKFIYNNLPLNFSQIHMNLEESDLKTCKFFVGKIKSGFLSHFLDRYPFHFYLDSLSIQQGLFKAWPFFTTREKEDFLDSLWKQVRPNLYNYTRSSYCTILNKNLLSVHEFFSILLRPDIRVNLFSDNPIRKYLLESTENSVYALHILICFTC